ncbi:uncharacterized protein CheB42b [Drosophila virilis]|uniref:Uncharacterized protein n=1 Tax=Drosophila virilis TaxID=7244 RepID=B4ME38_DROVI|nr:uncharacterized protein LOC6635949 [Drosophila virilis]EDW58803.1 uncharacterized protein Dvir_GJ18474 [Drosophila virilis]
MWSALLLLFSSQIVCCVLAADYEMIIDDPDIFSNCKEPPPGAGNIHSLLNMDELELTLDGDTIHIEGNATTVWDIQPGDRVAATARLMQLDRGVWQPTVFSIATQDFCDIMYDKDQYWYKYWTRYVKNASVMEKKCVHHKGAKLIHEPFDLKMVFTNIRGASLQGRYKVVVILEAFDDDRNVKRPKSICLEIIGDCEKL